MDKNKAIARSKRRQKQLLASRGRDRDYIAGQLQKAKAEIRKLKDEVNECHGVIKDLIDELKRYEEG